MEACATAHHWARELSALGHEVKLMRPAYVKAYVKRNKNDVADAEVICEAVTRHSMRFSCQKSSFVFRQHKIAAITVHCH
jgi:transposase